MSRIIRCLVAGILVMALVVSATAQKLFATNQNAALGYWQAFALIQDLDVSNEEAQELDGIVNGSLPWDEAKFGTLIDASGPALATMHRATRLPFCDWGLDSELGPNAPMAHIAKARALARLNALAGIRLVAQGKTQMAVDTWLYGFRFAQHLSQDGTMLGVLVANSGLSAQIHALIRTVGSQTLDDATLARIEQAVRAFPPYVFDWSRPMLTERGSAEFIIKMAGSKASLTDFQEILGQQMTQGDLDDLRASALKSDQEFKSIYSQAAAAFRLPYLSATPKLQELQANLPSMTKIVQQTVPNLGRFNDNRALLETDRVGLLSLVALRRSEQKNGHDVSSLLGLQIPDDPYSGKPFQIVKNAQGLQIQSVGKDPKGSPLVYQLNQ